MTATRAPRARRPRASAHATTVLPTAVSVPGMKKPLPVTDLVHVDEVIDMIVAVGARPGITQLVQCVRAQGAEAEEAVRLEHAATFGERGLERLAPLEHQAAEHHVHARIRERQAQRVRAHALEAPPPVPMP